ncbi:MAG: CDP-diacylglycerol--serine O-phosphatidyltransferase [Schwartzia sp. (in: firmicutes)]
MYRTLIPNMLTSSNLVFGMCSILATFRGSLMWGAFFILLALVADGLDGRAARFFGVSSEMGKEMDSLCDLISFGAAPGVLAYVFALDAFSAFGAAVAVCFALCGMWRLARFNVNASVVHGYFMGLAIPAGGCFVATSTLLFQAIGFDPHRLGWIYPVVMLFVAFLMVSEVHYPDFKGKGEKVHAVSWMATAAILAAILYVGREAIHFAVLFAIFASYASLGLFNTLAARLLGR